MSKIYAKIKSRGNANKYRVFTDSENKLYKRKTEIIEETVVYDPATIIESGIWYHIDSFTTKEYSIDILKEIVNPIDYEVLTRNEYDAIDYLFEIEEDDFYFQNIGKAKLVKKKGILRIGNDFKYYDDYAAIPINDYPDAICSKSEDRLYFRELSTITRIFPGISELFREATDQETDDFLKQDFIVVGTDFCVEKVKTPNRKRIALAMETLEKLKKLEKKKIFEYISEYCPAIKNSDNKSFKVNSDKDLTLLLYGIEERFYTTRVGNEKRIANSVIKM